MADLIDVSGATNLTAEQKAEIEARNAGTFVNSTDGSEALKEQFLSTQKSQEQILQEQAQIKVYYEAFQNVNQQLQQSGGGTITTDAINEEYNNLVETKYAGGVEMIDPVAQREYINQRYEDVFHPSSAQSDSGYIPEAAPRTEGPLGPVYDFTRGAYESGKAAFFDFAYNFGGPKEKAVIKAKGLDKTFSQPERDVASLVITANIEKLTTGKTDIGAKEFGKVGENIVANPSFAAGSLFVSALTFLGPAAASKVAKLGNVAKAANITSKAGAIAGEAAKAAKVPGKVFVQPVKITKAGDVVVLEPKGLGTAGLPKVERRQIPTALEIVSVESKEPVGYVSPITGYTVIRTGEELTMKQQGALLGQKFGGQGAIEQPNVMGELRASAITEVYAKEAKGLKRLPSKEISDLGEAVGVDPSNKFLITKEGAAVKLKEAKASTVAEFEYGDLLKASKASEKRASQVSKANEALAIIGETGRGKGPSSPLKFAKPQQPRLKASSASPLGTITIHRTDKELAKYGKAILEVKEKRAKEGEALENIGRGTAAHLGLGGGVGMFGSGKESLGFGGATGAEKVAKRKARVESVESFNATPPGFKIKNRQGNEQKTENISFIGTGESLGKVQNQSQKPALGQGIGEVTKSDLARLAGTMNLTDTITTPISDTTTGLSTELLTITTPVPATPTVPVPTAPKRPALTPTPYDPPEARKRARKGLAIMGGTTLKAFAAKNPFATSFSITKGGKFAKGLSLAKAGSLTGGSKKKGKKKAKIGGALF